MDMSYVGLIVGISGILIGLVSSYFFYRKGTRSKKPTWVIRSNNLVRDYASALQKMQILYKDELVPNVTVTKVLFWNEGSLTIDKDDIVESNPPRIVADSNVNILDVKVLASVRDSTNFETHVSEDRKSVYLLFDYLDSKHGAVIQVVHDGTSSKDLYVIGDIKGVPQLYSKPITPNWMNVLLAPMRRLRSNRRMMTLITIAISLIYVIFSISIWINPSLIQINPSASPTKELLARSILSGITFLGGLMLLAMSISMRRRFSLAPSGLEVFYE